MLQLRRIAAYLYARNKRFEESVELSKKVYCIFVYFEKKVKINSYYFV